MKTLPRNINGVRLMCTDNVVREVHTSLIFALQSCIWPDVGKKYDVEGATELKMLWITSAKDGKHAVHSRHYQGKAIDIGQVNEWSIRWQYPENKECQKLVQAVQLGLEQAIGVYENYGPALCAKSNEPCEISEHTDHIHFSVL